MQLNISNYESLQEVAVNWILNWKLLFFSFLYKAPSATKWHSSLDQKTTWAGRQGLAAHLIQPLLTAGLPPCFNQNAQGLVPLTPEYLQGWQLWRLSTYLISYLIAPPPQLWETSHNICNMFVRYKSSIIQGINEQQICSKTQEKTVHQKSWDLITITTSHKQRTSWAMQMSLAAWITFKNLIF